MKGKVREGKQKRRSGRSPNLRAAFFVGWVSDPTGVSLSVRMKSEVREESTTTVGSETQPTRGVLCSWVSDPTGVSLSVGNQNEKRGAGGKHNDGRVGDPTYARRPL
jgi:hypothetical protein